MYALVVNLFWLPDGMEGPDLLQFLSAVATSGQSVAPGQEAASFLTHSFRGNPLQITNRISFTQIVNRKLITDNQNEINYIKITGITMYRPGTENPSLILLCAYSTDAQEQTSKRKGWGSGVCNGKHVHADQHMSTAS